MHSPADAVCPEVAKDASVWLPLADRWLTAAEPLPNRCRTAAPPNGPLARR